MKKAIVIGSTGMVGTQLIELLIFSNDYSEIISLVRRESGIVHSKLKKYIVDFEQPESWKHLVAGDVLFSCMGTTIAKAKTKSNQFKIDYSYQLKVAEIASANAVPSYVLVSSAGANANSSTFYMKIKGQLEEAVKLLPFSTIIILRPGQLYGYRHEYRLGEKLALSIMFGLNKAGILRKFKPIHAREVAQAMINAERIQKSHTYKLNELFDIK